MPTPWLVRVGIILSISAALCDYVENLGIVAMILSWPDLSAPLVYASSAATLAKSIFTTAAVMIAIVIGVLATRYRIRRAS